MPDTQQHAPQDRTLWLQKKIWLPVAVLAGLALVIVLTKNKPPVQHEPRQAAPHPVTYVDVSRSQVKPAITGFGEVTPDILLKTVAEVSGKIVYLHPNLKAGSMLPAQTEVLRLDDLDYQLALKQAEANLAASQANLQEIDQTILDTKTNLALAQEKLTLAENELARLKKLKSKGSISQSNVDSQSSVVLQLKQEVQNLDNQMATLPSKRAVQLAQIQISEASVATQEHNLRRTRITLPFNARIDSVDVEEGSFVSTGTPLFGAQNVNKVKINAQFSLAEFRILAKGFDLNRNLAQEAFMNGAEVDVFQQLGLAATVRLAGRDAMASTATWQGNVERISGSLDPLSRTLGVTITVANPYDGVVPGVRPPLLQGMYTRITLTGKPQSYHVIPRDALHETEIYLVDTDDRLQRLPLQDPLPQSTMLLLEQRLPEQTRVITSDVFPAVPGMALAPQHDTHRQSEVARWMEAHQ